MNDQVYTKLAKVLDTLPNGFPATESGMEIKLLKKIFTSDEADLFCDLRLTPETAKQIAERTGRPIDGLEEKLVSMWKRGEVWGEDSNGVKSFKIIPWIVGIYEMQIDRMDREFCELCEEYAMHFGAQMLGYGPQPMQVVPIEKEISSRQEAMPYEQVSFLIENGISFGLNDCICKKERGILGNPCERPQNVCIGISTTPEFFETNHWGRSVSKEETYEVLRKSEEAGLVHMTNNVQSGNWFICNCCGCCCGVLRPINEFGIPASSIINSHYYAEIDPAECTACGVCLDERCQVKAIEEGEEAYQVIKERCIGCGLCVATCPSAAIRLVHKEPEELMPPAKDEEAWWDERGRQRGVDFSAYR